MSKIALLFLGMIVVIFRIFYGKAIEFLRSGDQDLNSIETDFKTIVKQFLERISC